MRPPGPLVAPDIVLAAPQCRALWATRPKSLNYAETTEQSNADKSRLDREGCLSFCWKKSGDTGALSWRFRVGIRDPAFMKYFFYFFCFFFYIDKTPSEYTYILIKEKKRKKEKIKIIYKEVISECDLQRAERSIDARVPSEAGWRLDDRTPLMDMMDALTRAKLKWQRIQLIVFP